MDWRKRCSVKSIYQKSINTHNKKRKIDEIQEEINGVVEKDLAELLDKSTVPDEKIERYDNHIYFYSEVKRESIFKLNLLLREIEEENLAIKNKYDDVELPIYLHIHSNGGCVFSGFSAVDMIMNCRVPVYTVIEGCAASAATLMSMVGKKRYIQPNSYMLIHQISGGCWGKMAEIDDEYNNLKELTDNIKKLYTENATIPKKSLNEMLKHDLWWNAEKCISYGLVDEIWKR